MNPEENQKENSGVSEFVDIVIPEKNEKDFFETAEKLSITNLCFLYSTKKFITLSNSEKETFRKEAKIKGITLSFGILVDDWKAFEKINSKGSNANFAYSFAAAKSSSTSLEEIFKKRKLNAVFGLESLERKDSLHYRRSGLNQVLCNIAKINGTSIAFSFSEILSFSGMLRSQFLGRINQNISLCRKYKVPMLIASFASSPYEMRTNHDLTNFFSVLGMAAGEGIESSKKVLTLISKNSKKLNSNYISEDIELIQ